MDESTLIPLLIAAWLLLMVLVAGAILTYDMLIRLEYETRPEQWERDGRLSGQFWTPPGTGMSERMTRFSSFGRSRSGFQMIQWLFKTPGWIEGYPEALRLLRRLRVLEGAAVLLVALWLMLFAMLWAMW